MVKVSIHLPHKSFEGFIEGDIKQNTETLQKEIALQKFYLYLLSLIHYNHCSWHCSIGMRLIMVYICIY